MRKNGKFINCKECRKKFYIPKYLFKRKKYCSLQCRNQDKNRIIKCQWCHKEFRIWKSQLKTRKYCSKKCHIASQSGQIPHNKNGKYFKCIVCGKKFYLNQYRIKQGAKFCSYKCYWKDMKGMASPRRGIFKAPRENRICIICKKSFSFRPRQNRTNLFCSHRCYYKIIKEQWQNPEYISKMFKAFAIKPNKPEILLTNFLQKILPNEYRYVGDGQLILAGKCPDFMNINGQKKLIELFGDYWHKGQNPQDRINLFKEHGFETLVIWERELKNDNLKERIMEFNL